MARQALAFLCGLLVACGCESSDEPSTGGAALTPVYCDVPATREQIVSTSRAGDVAYCSDAWVEAASAQPCVTPAACEQDGSRCIKEPGSLAEQCLRPCGDGLVCPEGTVCRDCEDSEPHCAASSGCPTPRVRRYDRAGDECTGTAVTVTPPDPAEVSQLCASFDAGCTLACLDSAECCNSWDGVEMACIVSERHYGALSEHYLYHDCVKICSTPSDCGADPSANCCMAHDSDDDEYATSRILGQASSTSRCWPRGIYDFCPALSGGDGGDGGDDGPSACEQCRSTCAHQGSWCQCDDECN